MRDDYSWISGAGTMLNEKEVPLTGRKIAITDEYGTQIYEVDGVDEEGNAKCEIVRVDDKDTGEEEG